MNKQKTRRFADTLINALNRHPYGKMSALGEKDSDNTKVIFTGKKEEWPRWSTQFLGIATTKKFKLSLLGKEIPPEENVELDEESTDNEMRRMVKYRSANERA